MESIQKNGISENRRNKREEQGAKTRMAIIEQAVKLFASKGYYGVSLREVAEASGTTKALLYHHFGSKDALYRAVQDRFREEYNEVISPRIADDVTDPDFLTTALQARFEFYKQNPEMARMVVWGMMEGSPMEPPSTEELRQKSRDRVLNAKESGYLRDDVSPRVVAGHVGCIDIPVVPHEKIVLRSVGNRPESGR